MLDIVETKYGKVRGLPGNNQFISVFKGIPFAKAPIGELRWKAPVEVEPWTGVLEAYEYANIPWQARFSSEGGSLAASEFYVRDYERSEDCLYLNIFTPAKTSDEKLPVAIYIHGGAYETGYGYLNAYDGESFAKEGIVYVTITYRLNVFGFLGNNELRKEDPNGSTGNYGLLDQIMAVNWVFENIDKFGGNPEDVTLVGQSAGGSSVQNLIQTDLLKGKVTKAIMQSGGGFNYQGGLNPISLEQSIEYGNQFLEFLNVKNIEEARKIPANELIEKYKVFKTKFGGQLIFVPCIDGYAISEDAFDYFKNGKHDDIKYLLGSTADEMRNKNKYIDDEYKKNYAFSRFDKDSAIDFLEKMENNYSNDYYNDPVGDDMRAGTIAFCENQIRLNHQPAYLYYFDYVPPGAEDIGAHHSAEHHYIFQTLNRSFRNYGLKDYDYSLKLSKMWANFIKTGDPSIDTLVWEPYSKESKKGLHIAEEIKLEEINYNDKVNYLVRYILDK